MIDSHSFSYTMTNRQPIHISRESSISRSIQVPATRPSMQLNYIQRRPGTEEASIMLEQPILSIPDSQEPLVEESTSTTRRQKRKSHIQPYESNKRRRASPILVANDEESVIDTNSIDRWCRFEKPWSPEHRKTKEESPVTQQMNKSIDQGSRENKSAPYRDVRYGALLAKMGSMMDKSDLGINHKSKTWVKSLLRRKVVPPNGSLFQDDAFEATCRKVRDKNESRIIQDIRPLLVPSVETLCTLGASDLDNLVESVNEGWDNSVPFTKVHPQPDYSVGFRREAFTEEQHQKLSPYVGQLTDQSMFMATYYQYFPFLTCEIQCGATGLDVADRQNAHSMTLAVRGCVELFRHVKREKELDGEILAFSVSHDHRSVRIYGHYADIDGKKTTYYRHPIHTFDFTALDGKDRWTAYKFTVSVYKSWAPMHFERLCSAIDRLPKPETFRASHKRLLSAERSGLSQDVGSLCISESSAAGRGRGEDSPYMGPEIPCTPDTSVTRG